MNQLSFNPEKQIVREEGFSMLKDNSTIIKFNGIKRIGAQQSSFLYRFDKRKYEAGLEDGVNLALKNNSVLLY